MNDSMSNNNAQPAAPTSASGTDQPKTEKRFLPIEDNPIFPNDGETWWWWDTGRPLEPGEKFIGKPFIAVQTYCDRDPNNHVHVEGLRLLFTDQAEYYAVCPNCYSTFAHMQWSGSTRAHGNWREMARLFLEEHQAKKGWCEFCDPIFGNGGWA